MAIQINNKINGQVATEIYSYCYLNEPLEIDVSITGQANTVFIDVSVYKSKTELKKKYEKLVKIDLKSDVTNNTVTIDLMKVSRSLQQTGLLKIGAISDMFTGYNFIFDYLYVFEIYTNTSSEKTVIKKIPILGGRNFQDFQGEVNAGQFLTEFEKYNLEINSVTKNWRGVPFFEQSIVPPVSSDIDPLFTTYSAGRGCYAKGVLVWKSRFGGWMGWGFDIETYKENGNIDGQIQNGLFEASDIGNTYVPVNYTSIKTSYTRTLKALALSNDEIKALSGIHASPAVYYLDSKDAENERMELMKVTSINAPINSLIDGGDFSISLSSVSTNKFSTL